jgi:L-ascorbate metabolism protein UlaG (beta-lactamase superfamily)
MLKFITHLKIKVMKKVMVTLAILSIAIIVSAQSSVNITYIANDGFLISGGAKNVLIDALFDKSFGRYDVPAEQLRKEMTEGKAPFNKVDLYLVTHQDGDHYYAPYVIDFLKKHSETQFISTDQVTAGLAGESNLKKQVTSISEEVGSMVDTTIRNISLKIYRVKHLGDSSGELSKNLAYLITLNNFKILHIGDGPFDFNKSTYEQFHLDKEKIDILFLEYFGQSDDKKQFVKEVIKPKYIVAVHIPPKELETESKQFLNAYSNGFVFKTPLETKTFTK